MKLGMLLSTASAALAWAAPLAMADEAGRLPEAWFVLPEDQAGYRAAHGGETETATQAGEVFRRGLDPVEKSLGRVFDASFEALDESAEVAGSPHRPDNAPADWAPWHLKEIIMDLGVSASGTVGVVTAKGEVTAEVYFQPTAERLVRLGIERVADAEDEQPADLQLTAGMAKLEIAERIDPVVEAVMATGRVSDKPKMRAGLLRVATELQDVMTNVNALNDGGWDVERFRLDVSIDGSGSVATGVTAGLGVRLRFEWVDSGDRTFQAAAENDDPKRQSFRVLMASLSRDLDAISAADYADSGFGLSKVRIGVGLYGKAKFGLIKGKLEGAGFVYLKQNTRRHPRGLDARIVLPDEIPLVTDSPAPAHVTYARQNGVKFETVREESGTEKLVYYMNRERFRAGLSRAARMGAFFAKRAAKSQSSNWRIYKVKPQFALSLEGATPLVTVGGKASLELEFKR